MFHLFETLQNFLVAQDRSNSCDDFADRLNRKYTVLLLVIFVTVLNSKQYIGEPLSCFCPAHFTGAHVEYTNNICMISRSFYISMDRSYLRPQVTTMPNRIDAQHRHQTTTTPAPPTTKPSKLSKLLNFGDRMFGGSGFASAASNEIPSPFANLTSNMNYLRVENLIAYYPFFIIGQAILFYLPFFLWKNFLNRTAYDLRTLIFIANEAQVMNNQYDRERTLRYLIGHIERAYDYYNCKAANNSGSTLERKGSRKGDSALQWLKELRRHVSTQVHHCIDFTLNPFRKCSDLDDIYSLQAHSIKNSMSPSGLDEPTFYSSVLFRVYLLKKFVYVLNSLMQFMLLSKFVAGQTKSNVIYNDKMAEAARQDTTYLADNSLLLGFEFGYNAISSLIRTGNLFEESSMLLIFHTVVFCDFQIRMLGDRLQRYTIQCVVPINVYTEKIFTIMWFWFLFLTLMNIYTFCKWFSFYVSVNVRLNFAYSNSLNINSNSIMAATLATAAAATSTSAGGKEESISSAATTNGHKSPSHKHHHSSSSKKHHHHHRHQQTAPQTSEASFFPPEDDDYYTKINRLYLTSTGTSNGRQMNERLVKNYLVHDRMFILKLISDNTNEIIAKELVTLSVETLNRKSFNNENTV